MEEKLNYLKLVEKPSLVDRFAKATFIAYLKLKGISTKKPKMILDKNGENFHAFRMLSCSYEENGEKVYRHIDCKDKLIDSIEGVETLCDILQHSVSKFPDKKFLGVRKIEAEETYVTENGKTVSRYYFGDFEWETYATCKTQVDNLSVLFLEHKFNIEAKVALFTDTCATWLLTAHALFQINSPVVTIYATLSDDNVAFGLNLLEVKGILVDKKSMPRLLEIIKEIPSIETIFCSEKCECDISSANLPESRIVKVIQLESMNLKQEVKIDDQERIKLLKPQAKDVALYMFTSGSTGKPKGVTITHENIVAAVSVALPKEFWVHRTYLAYLPQPHIYEFVAESVGIYNGFQIGFGHPLALFDESPLIMAPSKGGLPALRPDFFCTVPLLLERLKKACHDKIYKLSSVKQILYETAYNIKLNYMRAGLTTPLLDKMMFSKLREGLGGRAVYGYIGGATLNRDTEDFIYANFGMFKQAFGSTETCCAGTLGEFDYMATGNVGPPTRCVELKFVAWPEGGYSPDDPQGPRGEILLSGKTVSPGYVLNPEETNKCFVKDEKTGKIWYRTGDIGALLPDGTIKIIDRKKDIIKLKHGEYISLVHVENEILRSTLVDLVCAAPDSDYGFLVALIIPNRPAVKEFCEQCEAKFDTSDVEKLIENVVVQELLQQSIRDFVVMGKKLDKYEMPKKFCIVSDLWTPESGLITPSAKIRRHIITMKYKEKLI